MWFLKPEAAPTAPTAATAVAMAARTAALGEEHAEPEAAGREVARPVVTFGIGRHHRSRHR